MNRPLYFQLPSADPQRLVEFYHTVFGWTFGRLELLDNIWILVSGDPTLPGLNGIVMGQHMPCTVNVIAVDDLDQRLDKVLAWGGKITTPKQEIEGLGIFAWCADNDDNPFVLMQSSDQLNKVMLQSVSNQIPEAEVTSRPVHFEIPATDMDKVAEFYTSVLDWTVQKWQGPIQYTFLMTGDESSAGIDGALMEKANNLYPVNVMSTNDIDMIIEKIVKAGGKILMPKEQIPGVGLFAYALDPDNNQFGIMQFNQQQ